MARWGRGTGRSTATWRTCKSSSRGWWSKPTTRQGILQPWAAANTSLQHASIRTPEQGHALLQQQLHHQAGARLQATMAWAACACGGVCLCFAPHAAMRCIPPGTYLFDLADGRWPLPRCPQRAMLSLPWLRGFPSLSRKSTGTNCCPDQWVYTSNRRVFSKYSRSGSANTGGYSANGRKHGGWCEWRYRGAYWQLDISRALHEAVFARLQSASNWRRWWRGTRCCIAHGDAGGWTESIVLALSKMSITLQKEVMDDKTYGLMIELCETPC